MKLFWSSLLFVAFAFAAPPTLEPDSNPKAPGLATKDEIDPETFEFRKDFERFLRLSEESLVWRARAREFAIRINKKIENRQPLDGDDLQTIHSGVKSYLAMRRELFDIALKHRPLVDQYDFHIMTSRPTVVPPPPAIKPLHFDEAYGGDSGSYSRVDLYLNPRDARGRLISRQLKLSVASALILYDNFLVAIYPVLESKKFRLIINFDDPETKGALVSVVESYLSRSQRAAAHRALRFIYDLERWEKANGIGNDDEYGYLDIAIRGSLSYFAILDYRWTDVSGWKLRMAHGRITDAIRMFRVEAMDATSKLVGNTVGYVQSRHGHLKDLGDEELAEIRDGLEPLDVLLEKTPFRLTDKFIPGHYGHVAIWVGTQDDLKALDLVDHPAVEPHLNKIKRGYSVIEAVRPGVQINTLRHFMNIDDLAVIRPLDLTRVQKRVYMIKAFQQIGKEYDFNFDVETLDKIVCSELAFQTFGDIDFPVKRELGRYTISPDQVAVMALPTGDPYKRLVREEIGVDFDMTQRFQITELWHDGRKVRSDIDCYYRHLVVDRKSDPVACAGSALPQFMTPNVRTRLAH